MNSSAHDVLGYLHSLLSRHRGEQDDDRELLHRFRELRDGDAFALLMRRHGPMVLGLAHRILGDAHLADDVFQAAFLLLARKAPAIRRAESLSCWLHGVAFRLALRVCRSHQRRQERETHFHLPSSPSPLEELTAQELLTVLDEELHKLPENQRAPLILCCLEGLSQEEAAWRLGCSAAAVKGRLERGRQRLRLRLEKRGLTLPAVFGGTLLIGGSTSPIPAVLVQATLQAATAGRSIAPAVAALLEEAMRSMFVNKVKIIGVAAMLLTLSGAGASILALRPQATKEGVPPAASDDKPLSVGKRIDLYGDALPEGAVMRLGTLRRRAIGAQLAVTADGKSIVGVRAGRYISIWDAGTGKLREKRELPVELFGRFALSPDGRWLARNEYNNLRCKHLEIWDVRTGRKVRELTIEGTVKIGSFAFSVDGTRVAITSDRYLKGPGRQSELLIRVWDLADGKEIFRKDLRISYSSDVLAFAPDGNHLLTSFHSIEEGLYCWDIATGKKLWQYKEYGLLTASTSLAFTRDGKILSRVIGPQMLDLDTGKMNPILGAPPIDWDKQLTLTPDGRTLLISTAKGVIVWDMVHGKKLRTLPVTGEMVVTPDSKAIITNNCALQRWDLAMGKPVWSDISELGHIDEVHLIRFSEDGKRLVSASEDGTVRLWNAATGRPLRVWRGHEPSGLFGSSYISAGVQRFDISADGRRIVSAGKEEECIKLWDIDSDKEIRTIALPRPKVKWNRRIYHLRISPDGRRITAIFGPKGFTPASGRSPEKRIDGLALWDAETGKLLEIQDAVDLYGVLSPDGRSLLKEDTTIDVRSGNEIAKLPGYGWETHGSFARDGALIAGQAHEKRGLFFGPAGPRVWEAWTGKIVTRVQKKSWVDQAIFHPDNRYFAINNHDGISIYDARSGEIVARFTMPETVPSHTSGGNSYAGCLVFSRDGGQMATGMPDGTILVWKVSLPPARPLHLTTKELETLWADLADADAAKAWRAVWRLADVPQGALTLLCGRVKPSPTASADLTRKLLADLDSDSFAAREAAAKHLKELGLQAEPALRAALNAKPSLEQRRRIEPILAALSEIPEKPSQEELRQLRALIVLERIGSPEARRLLEEAANGPPSARLTRQARACLACLHD